jgi:probable phosphoglycerate mutase
MNSRWPSRLWIVRHGESAGNVARDQAHSEGLDRIDIRQRDVDVPLSELGRAQAASLGRWFAALPPNARPDVVITSPYLRACGTASAVSDAGGLAAGTAARIDERLREREFGILDRLTSAGIMRLYPEQAELRKSVGKFYHRPPGGESWCDVILRLRSVLNMLSLHFAGRRVLIIAHQVVVLCLRYLLEDMTEAEILKIDGEGDVAHLHKTGAAVTAEPDKSASAR